MVGRRGFFEFGARRTEFRRVKDRLSEPELFEHRDQIGIGVQKNRLIRHDLILGSLPSDHAPSGSCAVRVVSGLFKSREQLVIGLVSTDPEPMKVVALSVRDGTLTLGDAVIDRKSTRLNSS